MFSLTASDLRQEGSSVDCHDPTWEQIEACIRRLDGERFTEVSLNDGDMSGIMITGGFDGRLMCERLHPDRNWLLIDPDKSDRVQVEILVNGPKDFPEQYIVDPDTVIRATKTFFETGERDERFTWID
jgi:hypothetical protein